MTNDCKTYGTRLAMIGNANTSTLKERKRRHKKRGFCTMEKNCFCFVTLYRKDYIYQGFDGYFSRPHDSPMLGYWDFVEEKPFHGRFCNRDLSGFIDSVFPDIYYDSTRLFESLQSAKVYDNGLISIPCIDNDGKNCLIEINKIY